MYAFYKQNLDCYEQVHSIQLPTSDCGNFGPSTTVTALAFDTQQELLWIGDNHVRSASQLDRDQ